MMGIYAWLVVALFFLILEMGHPGLFFWLSFSLGSLIAAVFSWYDYSWSSVLMIFLGSSFVAIALLKATVGRYLALHMPHARTNVDALIGKSGLVVKPIYKDTPGSVRVGGEIWTARSLQEEEIQEGTRIKILVVKGAHLIVTASRD